MDFSKSLRKVTVVFLCAVLLVSSTTIFAAGTQETASSEQVKSVTLGTVSCSVLNVRSNPGTENAIVGKLYKGEVVVLGAKSNDWYYMTNGTLAGYVSAEYITDVKTITEEEYQELKAQSSAEGANIASYAMNSLGKSYAAGGNGPNSFDCSGLVTYVYKNFGMTLPRSSYQYATVGTTVAVADIQPGDIMCFNPGGGKINHVGIYVGNGQMIHAATPGRGVVLDSIYDSYYSKNLNRVCRVL